ncbi:MAG: hypothetical protein AAB621_01550 [Patescibacteria group bacterium]
MKNKISLTVAIFIASLFIIPQITFAAWWNPGTWKIFNRKVEVKIEQKIIATSTPDNRIVDIEKTKTSSKIENIISTSTNKINISKKKSPLKNTVKIKTAGELKLDTETAAIQANKKQEAIEKQKIIETQKQINKTINNFAVVAIDAFLLNPTIDNLRLFCNTAKTLPGIGEKKVLNDTRTDFVMKTVSLYETNQINGICNLALGESKSDSDKHKAIQWVVYNSSYILEFNPDDLDAVREIKINYNNSWKSLSSYKLIGFPTYSTSSEITTPNAVMGEMISRYIKTDEETLERQIQKYTLKIQMTNFEYIIPEKILSYFRTLFLKLINGQLLG